MDSVWEATLNQDGHLSYYENKVFMRNKSTGIISCKSIEGEENVVVSKFALVLSDDGQIVLNEDGEILTLNNDTQEKIYSPFVADTIQEEANEESEIVVEDASWTEAATLFLLNILEEDKLPKFKTKGKKWEYLAQKMEEKGYKFNATQVRNRWSTLERGLKRVNDHNKKTGRNKKKLQVSPAVLEVLNRILNKKDSVSLPHILDNSSIESGNEIRNVMVQTNSSAPPSHLNAIMEAEDTDNSDLQIPTSSKSLPTVTVHPTPSPTLYNRVRAKRKSPICAEISKMNERQESNHAEKMAKLSEQITETRRMNDIFENYNRIFEKFVNSMTAPRDHTET